MHDFNPLQNITSLPHQGIYLKHIVTVLVIDIEAGIDISMRHPGFPFSCSTTRPRFFLFYFCWLLFLHYGSCLQSDGTDFSSLQQSPPHLDRDIYLNKPDDLKRPIVIGVEWLLFVSIDAHRPHFANDQSKNRNKKKITLYRLQVNLPLHKPNKTP